MHYFCSAGFPTSTTTFYLVLGYGKNPVFLSQAAQLASTLVYVVESYK